MKLIIKAPKWDVQSLLRRISGIIEGAQIFWTVEAGRYRIGRRKEFWMIVLDADIGLYEVQACYPQANDQCLMVLADVLRTFVMLEVTVTSPGSEDAPEVSP